MSRSDVELMMDALDHIEVLKNHIAREDMGDQLVADAVSLRLAAAIESLYDLTPDFRNRLFGDEWKLMWATRNRISHGYAYVDLEMITSTVTNDVPVIEAKIRAALEK